MSEQGIDDIVRGILEEPFPEGKVKVKQGQGGRKQSYVSHGLITERLTQADPDWRSKTVEVFTSVGADGRLHCEGVLIELTVCGVTRAEAGGPQRLDGFTNEIKNAESDALKRAAMRFGVALSIWESLVDSDGDEDTRAAAAYEAHQQRAPAQGPHSAASQPAPAARPNLTSKPVPVSTNQGAQTANAKQRMAEGSVDPATGEIAHPAASPEQGGAKFKCNPEQIGEIRELREALGWDLERLNLEVKAVTGIASVKLVDPGQAAAFIRFLRQLWGIVELTMALGWSETDVKRTTTALFPEQRGELSPSQRDELIEFMSSEAAVSR